MSGYDRDLFGQAWLDTDRNGCDTRNDILARDLAVKQIRPGTNGCVVDAGELDDRYTGTTIDFIRGPGDLVDIDHVVPLGNAWVDRGTQLGRTQAGGPCERSPEPARC